MILTHKKILMIFCFGLLAVMLDQCCFAEEKNADALAESFREKLKDQVKKSSSPFEKKSTTPQLPEVQDQPVPQVGATSAATPVASPAESDPKAEEKNIFLNFENTELLSFINYMAELKQINLIPDKTLEGVKISLTVRTPLTVSAAWRIFLTVVEMANFSMVKVGDVYKVIPKDQTMVQPLPSYINVPIETLPESDKRIRYVLFLDNIGAKSVEALLDSMLSDQGKKFTYEDSNGFVITDKSYNIRSAVRLLQELDATGQTEAVVVMKLKNVNAGDVKELLKGLIGEEQNPLAKLLGKSAESSGKYFPPGTKIIAEERTNSLVLLGLSDVIKKIEDFIVTNIDTELKATESPIHIYELQYTDAKQIKEILKAVVNPETSSEVAKQAQKYGAIRGGVKYFRSMNFEVDSEGNRLIVSSTDKEDWELLKKTIKDLDKPQPQVAIETLLVSISANDVKRLGGAVRNKKGKFGNVNFQSAPHSGAFQFDKTGDSGSPISLLGNMLNGVANAVGSSVLTFGKSANIWGIFESIKTVTNATILSQPFITVANKTPANIKFGETRRVPQESGSDQTGYVSLPATTNLKVTPLINLDGVIRLDIDIDNDTFSDTESSSGNTQTQHLKTNVTIADGQVLVLGGFIESNVQVTKNKTPLLGDLPLIGWLFKTESRQVIENYIFYFMAPTIIKPRTLPGMGLYTRMKLHQATDSIKDGIVTSKTKDPIFNWFFNPENADYSRKVLDYANARYQPTMVDIKNDPYYRSNLQRNEGKNDNAYLEEPLQEAMGIRDQSDRKLVAKKKDIYVEEAQKPSSVKESSSNKTKSLIVNLDQKPVVTPVLPPQESTMKAPEQSLLASTNVQDRVLKKLQERRQEVMRVDNGLDQRRAKLKEMVPSPALVPKVEPVVVAEQRTQFKELLSSPSSPIVQELVQPAALEKRNRLKDFLSRSEELNAMPLETEKRNQLKNFLSRGQEATYNAQDPRNTKGIL